jgi:hypothetical protein
VFQHPAPVTNIDPAITDLLDNAIDKWIRQTAEARKSISDPFPNDASAAASPDADGTDAPAIPESLNVSIP